MSARVGIVGAGPCGVFTALLLAREGLEVRVFERRSAPNPHPRAMGITRRTAEIFLQCGLLGKLEAGAMDTSDCDLALWCRSLAGGELGRVPIPEISTGESPCRPLHVPQTHTENVLREALAAEAGDVIRWGVAVEKIEPGVEGVRVTPAGGEPEVFDWLVAADGAGSAIRKSLGIGTTGPGDMGHFLNVFFRTADLIPPGSRRAVLYNVFGGELFEFFVAVNGSDLWLMHHFLQPGERAEDFPAPRLKEMIRRAAGRDGLEPDILGVSPWVMSPALAKTWRRGRVFLTGDASARLSPAGGLGLNTGLQSVWNLAWKLGAVAAGRAPDALLDTYEQERRPWAQRLMGATNSNAEEIFAAVAAAIAGDWERVRTMAASSRRHVPDTELDLGGRYEAGAWIPEAGEESSPGALPGSRAPHLELADGKSILKFFGRGFVLLAGREGAGWAAGGLPRVLVNGREFFAEGFESAYGIAPGGAVLVRPDGVVGARFAGGGGPEDVASALGKILNPPPRRTELLP